MIQPLTYREIFLNVWRHCKLPTISLLVIGGLTITFHVKDYPYSTIIGISLLTLTSIYMTGLGVSWLIKFRKAMDDTKIEYSIEPDEGFEQRPIPR